MPWGSVISPEDKKAELDKDKPPVEVKASPSEGNQMLIDSMKEPEKKKVKKAEPFSLLTPLTKDSK